MILQNIWRKIVDNVLMNISPSNIFLRVRLTARFHQNCQATFGRCEHYWVKMIFRIFLLFCALDESNLSIRRVNLSCASNCQLSPGRAPLITINPTSAKQTAITHCQINTTSLVISECYYTPFPAHPDAAMRGRLQCPVSRVWGNYQIIKPFCQSNPGDYDQAKATAIFSQNRLTL